MPLMMVVGIILHRPISIFEEVTDNLTTPILIFIVLFTSLCRVDIKDMKFTKLHLVLIVLQIICSVGVYAILLPLNPIIAQGAMICILTPIAMSAIAVGGMLGANITSIASYSLLCNIAIAFIAPIILSEVSGGESSFYDILTHVGPLLILPFICAQMCRYFTPSISNWIIKYNHISFSFWLLSLMIIMGRTATYILELDRTNFSIEIWLAVVALIICIVQFAVGRMIGRYFGEEVVGGQSFGQKNTLLAIWMAHSYLNPISALAPTAYIVWQNIVNSYQIYKKRG